MIGCQVPRTKILLVRCYFGVMMTGFSTYLDYTISVKVDQSLRVEHMAGRCKCVASLFLLNALDQGWKEQDHVTTLIHDRCSAKGTLDLAGQMVGIRLVSWVVPTKIVNSVGEVDVFLVEDCSPLERCLAMSTIAPKQKIICSLRVVFDRYCSDKTWLPRVCLCSART